MIVSLPLLFAVFAALLCTAAPQTSDGRKAAEQQQQQQRPADVEIAGMMLYVTPKRSYYSLHFIVNEYVGNALISQYLCQQYYRTFYVWEDEFEEECFERDTKKGFIREDITKEDYFDLEGSDRVLSQKKRFFYRQGPIRTIKDFNLGFRFSTSNAWSRGIEVVEDHWAGEEQDGEAFWTWEPPEEMRSIKGFMY